MKNSISSYLDRIRKDYGERTAFRFFEQDILRSISYSGFVDDVYSVAERLQDYKGGHIAILARNSYVYIVNLFGIMMADAVVVTLNIEESWNNLKKQLEVAEIDLMLHDGEYNDEESELLDLYGNIMTPLALGGSLQKPMLPVSHDDPDDLALILFTSGTSSISKGVMLSSQNLMVNAKGHSLFFDFVSRQNLEHSIQFYLCLPLYYSFELSMMSACLYSGNTIAINRSKSFFQREIEMLECNCAAMVPSMLQVLAKHLKRKHKEKLGKMKAIITAGAASSPELLEIFEQNNIRVIKHYGMSENSVITANYLPFPQKKESVGLPFGDTQVAIQQGEVLVRSSSLMLGYYKNQEMTAQTLQNGWLYTGDMGYLDEDGYLYLTGKKKNLIILATGENVNPEELENLILEDENVKETIVKEKSGKICAEIFCDVDKQDEVREFVMAINRKLAIYKRMSLIEFRSEPFSRTSSGKIKRNRG